MADDVTTKILEIQVDYGDAVSKIAEYRQQLESIKQRQNELKQAVKEGAISQEEYHKSMEASKIAAGQLNSAIATISKQVKNQITSQKEANGSLVALRAELSKSTAEYDRLSKAEREGAKGTALKEHINEITAALKGAEEGTQRFQRNVGNYEGAVAPVKQQLRELTEQLINMKAAGMDSTPEFQAMMDKASELKDAMADVTQQINVYASDTAQLDVAVQGISSLVNMYTIWQSVSKGVGIESEALDKTMNAIMGTMAVLNSLQQIQNALQKQSALVKGIDAAKTWLQNTALGAHMAAMTASTAATGGATVATWAWNAALYANPLMWLIGIIVAAVAAVYGLIKAFSFFTSDSEKRKEALKKEAEALEELHTLNEKAVEMAAARGASQEEQMKMTIDNLKAEQDAWERHFDKISQEYDEDDDEYKEALDRKKKAHEDFIASLDEGLVHLTKIQTEQREWERKEALGEYEYKRTLIKEQTKQQIELAKQLLKYNKITKAEYDALVADLNKLQTRKISEVDKAESDAANKAAESRRKAAADAAKSAADAAKKRQEEEKKRQEEYYKEVEKAQDALLALIKEGLDKQLEAENLAYQRGLKALQEKLAQYKTNSEYDVKMRQAINDQIYALTVSHERKVAEFQWSEHERQIKIAQETLQSKLEIIKKGTDEELQLRHDMLAVEHQQELDAIDKRISDGLLTEEQGNILKLNLEEAYRKRQIELAEEYDQLDLNRKKAALQAEIDAMQLAEDERQLRQAEGWQMSDEQYAQWRQRGLEEMDAHEREILLKQEEAAAAELEALIARGQLSTQTTEEYEAEILAAKQRSAEAQKKTNDTIVKNEQAKAQAMKAITGGLTQLLDTLGESNKAFAKMSKIITLAQIAIDTGKALASGIASASSMPYPSNLVAIATTVATVLANVATAISTVKSAKFAKGGKVKGPGTGTSDSIPAMLSNGEYVMTAEATRRFEPLLDAMNSGEVKKAKDNIRTEISGIASETSHSEKVKFLSVITKYYEEIKNHRKETDIKESLYSQLARQVEIFNFRKELLTNEHFTEVFDSHIQRLESIFENATSTEEIKEALLSEIRSIRFEHHPTDRTEEAVVAKSVMTDYVTTSKDIEEHLKEFVDIISVFKTVNSIDNSLNTRYYQVPDVSPVSQPHPSDTGDNDVDPVQPKGYAIGGKVSGPGTGTSDSVPVMLSNGEFVMTSAATRLFEPLLMTMNNIGRGVPMQVLNSSQNISTAEMLTDSFESAAREIKPVVSVVEITEAQDRVEMIENLDTY